ncbi:ATP-binding protein [Luteimonas sp. MHLX1A]|uniref:ATP-binding protein n=1 Tax=Alterluteimonas muca TaxID=2878684 RepID=UPI001E36EB73|nr:ATP-binding protein [Luteimonas sp. MHLX1A]MCD9047886.1 ATP-binding protein [Luteimonas sp. MHLX1A]
MRSTDAPNRVLFGELPAPADEQFRMRTLQVWNWGTFSRLHTIDIAEDGMLLLGPSGAGKSTLLDAISAMIVPPTKVHFNAAAEEGERGGRDRTLMSYVRGAWADKGEEGSRDVSKQFLRPEATWSAIALTYANRLGRMVTLIRLFWVTSASPTANINRHFMVVDGPFDLARELTGFDGDRRKLRQQLDRPAIRHHEDSFAAYQEHWCRVMGIEDTTALELLHRTQSTKSLGDLNSFLREFMLAPPETFEKARLLVEEFSDLDEAHRAVVAARQQVELLKPAQEAFAQRLDVMAQLSQNDELIQAAPRFIEHHRVTLLEQSRIELQTAIEAARAEIDVVAAERHGVEDQINALEGQRLAHGGNDIATLEAKIGELTGQREHASSKRRRAESAAGGLGWTLATDAAAYAAQQAEARAIASQAIDRANSAAERRGDLEVRRRDQEQEFARLREEIHALETSSSNIPAEMQHLRARMCRELSLAPANVMFVGELIQVRADTLDTWGPAAERLLRGFALDLLIDERDHKRVARWVDDIHLGLKLVYHPVTAGSRSARREPRSDDSILHKLETRAHAFTAWVERELSERFDYQCVDTAADLTKGPHRITRQGQIRHGGGRTEKNDRHRIDDRSRWVLGFDSREKLALYKAQAATLGEAIVETRRAIDVLDSERQQDHVRQTAAQSLLSLDWHDIDVLAIAGRIADIEAQLTSIRSGNRQLADIEGQLAAARARRTQLHGRAAELAERVKSCTAQLAKDEPSLDRARMEAAMLSVTHRDALQACLPEGWAPTLASVAGDVQPAVNALHETNRRLGSEASELSGQVTQAFARFLMQWPEEAGALQANLNCAPDFFARLQRLELDGLPEHETRFMALLRQQSRQRLAELARHLAEARREITNRLADVNEALYAVNYNPDSYLRIRVVDLHLPEPTAFRQRLSQLFADQHGQATADAAVAEAQFNLLRELVLDLKADEPEKRRWRDAVLDVRRHVEFIADELERRTDRQIEVYSGSSGKSGGQRQKLTATCLAAALRYKLGGADGGVPQYAAVVLDEAFTKTDNDFTATSMRIFTELGFQMIVATPIKSVMTLEEFVGGAAFVVIRDRKQSGLLAIEYDSGAQRLSWTEQTRAARDAIADADA